MDNTSSGKVVQHCTWLVHTNMVVGHIVVVVDSNIEILHCNRVVVDIVEEVLHIAVVDIVVAVGNKVVEHIECYHSKAVGIVVAEHTVVDIVVDNTESYCNKVVEVVAGIVEEVVAVGNMAVVEVVESIE